MYIPLATSIKWEVASKIIISRVVAISRCSICGGPYILCIGQKLMLGRQLFLQQKMSGEQLFYIRGTKSPTTVAAQ